MIMMMLGTSDWKPNPRLLATNTTKFLNFLLLQQIILFRNYHLVVLIKSIFKYQDRIRETSSIKYIYIYITIKYITIRIIIECRYSVLIHDHRTLQYCVHVSPLPLLLSETQSVTERRTDTVNCIHDKQLHITSTLQAKREHDTRC